MRITLCSLLIWVVSLSGWSQDPFHFTIKGQLPDSGNDGSYMYLMLENAEDWVSRPIGESVWKKTYVDSVLIRDGQFIFNRSSSKKGELYTLESQDRKIAGWVIGESGEINVVFGKKNERVNCSYASGTPLNDQLTDEVLIPYGIFFSKVDSVVAEKGIHVSPKSMAQYYLEAYKHFSKFIKTHLDFPAGECFLMLFYPLKEEDKNEIWPRLSERVKELYEKRKTILFQTAQSPDSVNVGHNFIDFTLPTLANKPLTLSEVVKGKKLVLLDFWASWCGPCLAEVPKLVEIYSGYKEKGLEIIGISLDGEAESWEEAVRKNKMSWPQILNQKIGEKNLNDVYGVANIPYTILIDQDGKILSRGLRGVQLTEEIRKLMQ